MAATELAAPAAMAITPGHKHPARGELRWVAYAAVTLVTASGLGVALELVDRELFTSAPPHPTLHPTVAAIASIFATNLRILAVPFILIVFGFASTPAARAAGDLTVIGILGANAVHIGLAIGRWQTRLLPYLPHLPFELLAATTAAAAWLSARHHAHHHRPQAPRATAAYAALTVLLLGAAATVEVLLTPHAR